MSEHAQEINEQVGYNLRTDFEGVKKAMADVERGGWLKTQDRIAENWEQSSEGDRHASLEGARRWLETVNSADDAWYTVYGDGGIDRWYIHADGRVRFSRFHASPPGLERARVRGFWID